MLNRKQYRVYMIGNSVGIAIYASKCEVQENGFIIFIGEFKIPEMNDTYEQNVAHFDKDSVYHVLDLTDGTERKIY